MKKKNFLFNFLIFSMLILIILIGILTYRKYKYNYATSKLQYNKETNIENNYVQSDIKEGEEQRAKAKMQEASYKVNDKPVEEIEKVERVREENIETEILQVNLEELIVNSTDYSSRFVNALIMQLSYIPPKIINDFNNNGWKILIVSEEEMYSKLSSHQAQIYSIDAGNFIKGNTKISDKTIYITYHSITLRDNTIIHEIGHYYDMANGWISCTEEYMNIYEKEKDTLNSETTEISSSKELFAETFEYVILEEEGYENLETYQYIKDILYHH